MVQLLHQWFKTDLISSVVAQWPTFVVRNTCTFLAYSENTENKLQELGIYLIKESLTTYLLLPPAAVINQGYK